MITKSQKNIGLLILVLLLIPLIVMQFTNEVNWTVFDFIIMGGLLSIIGFSCELMYRKITNPKIKISLIISLLILFLLIWAELAVGIFNSPIAGS